ncbi:MAG: GTPase Era [Gemmatimonadota bacterium]
MTSTSASEPARGEPAQSLPDASPSPQTLSAEPLPHDGESEAVVSTRCGYVTLLGAPNVGKSTLMNTMIGDSLSIVTSKAQTTWTRVTGIRTDGSSQMIFLDTPGVLTPTSTIHQSFLSGAREAVAEADVVVPIADPLRPLQNAERMRLEEMADTSDAVRIGVVNKVDTSREDRIAAEREWLSSLGCVSVHEISALEGHGVPALLEAIDHELPPGPFLYPDDEIASAPVRFFVAEMVREAIFEIYREEIPYASICRVEEFRDGGERTYIQVTIYVERASQKGIIIGDQGRSIRELGIRARKRVEHFLQRPVYLDLWVKVLPNWRRKPRELRRFGLPVPDEDRARASS